MFEFDAPWQLGGVEVNVGILLYCQPRYDGHGRILRPSQVCSEVRGRTERCEGEYLPHNTSMNVARRSLTSWKARGTSTFQVGMTGDPSGLLRIRSSSDLASGDTSKQRISKLISYSKVFHLRRTFFSAKSWKGLPNDSK
jgi:hypothetical protein